MMSGSRYDSGESCPSWVFWTSGWLLRPQAMSAFILFCCFIFVLPSNSLIAFCFAINQAFTPAALSSKICVCAWGRIMKCRGGHTCTFCGPERDVISYWGGTDRICFLFASYMKYSCAPDWTYAPCKPQLIHSPLWSLSPFAHNPAHTHTHTGFDAKNNLSIARLPKRKGSQYAAPRGKLPFWVPEEYALLQEGMVLLYRYHITQNVKKTQLILWGF